MSREEFIAKGYKILGEFEHGGEQFMLYEINPVMLQAYITGSRFDWQFGLRWDTELRSIVKDFAVEDAVKRQIELVLIS